MNVGNVGIDRKGIVIDGGFIVVMEKIQIHKGGGRPVGIAMNKARVVVTALFLEVIKFQHQVLDVHSRYCGQ